MSLTADQQAEVRAQARANPACAQPLVGRDLDQLAAILSVGRVRPSALTIGNGTVLDVLGLVEGSQFLAFITGNQNYRFVVPLLEQGRLLIGSGPVQEALEGFVLAGAVTQEGAEKLRALGFESDPLDRLDVESALFNPDGTEK